MNKQTLLGERLRRKADDPRDAEIARLREALIHIHQSAGEAANKRWGLKYALLALADHAAQALAEPGEKP